MSKNTGKTNLNIPPYYIFGYAPVEFYDTVDFFAPATFSSTADFNGAVTATSTVDVSGAATFTDTVDVSGAATFTNTVDVSGAATFTSTVDVSGAATFTSTVDVTEGNFRILDDEDPTSTMCIRVANIPTATNFNLIAPYYSGTSYVGVYQPIGTYTGSYNAAPIASRTYTASLDRLNDYAIFSYGGFASGVATSTSLITILGLIPSGYRPAAENDTIVWGRNGTFQTIVVAVNTSGDVTMAVAAGGSTFTNGQIVEVRPYTIKWKIG